MSTIDDEAAALLNTPPPALALRVGVVTSTGPLEVSIGGASPAPARKAAETDLDVDDVVAVLVQAGDLWVLGKSTT